MKRTKKPLGAGVLFQREVRSLFLTITGKTYDNMLARIMRKGFPGVPFDKDAFRHHVLRAMGGLPDGFFRCRYCSGYFTLEQVAVDHALPLSRGGGVDLDNLEFPCKADNFRKGSLTPDEYILLLEFLDQRIPLAKTDVLNRLEISVQLVTAERARKAKERREAAQVKQF
jgi:hypothetical protein